jgi:hypothetical protein
MEVGVASQRPREGLDEDLHVVEMGVARGRPREGLDEDLHAVEVEVAREQSCGGVEKATDPATKETGPVVFRAPKYGRYERRRCMWL